VEQTSNDHEINTEGERIIEAETPDYTESPAEQKLDAARAGRLLLALTAETEELTGLLRSADPELIRSTLKNPHLGEAHLLALLKRSNLPEGLIRSIHRVPQLSGSRRLKIALAGHPATPAPILADILGQLHLLELTEVLRLPGAAPDHKAAAQQAILKRLPDTELGTKITLARRGTAAVLEALLAEGSPRLVAAVLANPALTEACLLAFLRSPAATDETISAVARHPRWGVRPKLRLAALRNRKTPAVWFTLFLPDLGTPEVKGLLGSQGLGARQQEAVLEELNRRARGNLR
jgi:hypothetical protein